MKSEFPPGADGWPDGLSRRDFVKLAGASIALAGAACTRQPLETIVPYAVPPEKRVQGEPQWFATAIPFRGYGIGILAKSFEGRPIKLEGNPDHPASLGATNAFVQASILDLYDPNRATTPRRAGVAATWDDFAAEVRSKGRLVHILTQTVTSPALRAQIARYLAANTDAKWHQYEPFSRDAVYAGTRAVFGTPLEPLYRFDRAAVVVALDANFLADDPGSIRYAHDFATRRDARLYAFEPMPTVTGAAADHRFARRASEIMVDAELLLRGIEGGGEPPHSTIARDLLAHRGAALVVAGDAQPPEVHALAHAMNAALGAIGQTVDYVEPIGAENSLADLTRDLDAGAVDVLLIVGGSVPQGLNVHRASLSAHLSPYPSTSTTWHLPESHPLESWGDIRAYDGTASIIQPLVAPFYDTRSAIELMSIVAGAPQSGHDIVKSFWSGVPWEETLSRGVVAGSAARVVPPSRRPFEAGRRPALHEIEISVRPDPTIWDGRYAHNGWLQELPKPITKLVWGSGAFISPEFAKRLGVGNEDVVEIAFAGQTTRAPVWIVPGHADNSVTLFAASPLMTTGTVNATGEKSRLISTQEHNTIEGRDLLRGKTPEPKRDESLYPPYKYEGHAWGMAIDLDACIGCGGCVVACNVENNIPFVGPDQADLGREMQWLRIDRYFDGDEIVHQPILCMHCENAPCEPVCPVEATVHSVEGLNEMVYNRCIGTRYCSNNCPYKVRRFNFLQYTPKSAAFGLMWNPDVTVRTRGVMEKCTYCVQRIERTRIAADAEQRPIRDGEVVTACQQSCPTQAIVFGDCNDPNSRVSQLKKSPRNFSLLAELNTRPRTTYLSRVRNPNPELEKR